MSESTTDLDLQTTPCGATSSRQPRFDLIPRDALAAVADRFELGLTKYGKDNWRKGEGNRDYVIERLTHVINHAFIAIEKLEGRRAPDGDDDIAAIAWGGLVCWELTKKDGVR